MPPPNLDENEILKSKLPLARYFAYGHSKNIDGTYLDIDDLIQEGLIGYLKAMRRHDINKGASLDTYAKIRMRGAIADEVKFQFSDWHRSSVEMVNIDDNDQLIDDYVADESLMDKVKTLMQTLPENHRNIIEGIFFNELTAVSVAKELGISEGRVSQIKNEAIKKLIAAL